MKRKRNLLLFGLAATFVLAACTAPAVGPIEQSGEAESDPVRGELAPASPSASAVESPEPSIPTPTQRDFRIITLLPRDAIPAIDDPEYYNTQEADEEYDPEEQVLGIFFDGQARAYSVAKLSRHEIVNDTVGGRAIAVTW